MTKKNIYNNFCVYAFYVVLLKTAFKYFEWVGGDLLVYLIFSVMPFDVFMENILF